MTSAYPRFVLVSPFCVELLSGVPQGSVLGTLLLSELEHLEELSVWLCWWFHSRCCCADSWDGEPISSPWYVSLYFDFEIMSSAFLVMNERLRTKSYLKSKLKFCEYRPSFESKQRTASSFTTTPDVYVYHNTTQAFISLYWVATKVTLALIQYSFYYHTLIGAATRIALIITLILISEGFP